MAHSPLYPALLSIRACGLSLYAQSARGDRVATSESSHVSCASPLSVLSTSASLRDVRCSNIALKTTGLGIGLPATVRAFADPLVGESICRGISSQQTAHSLCFSRPKSPDCVSGHNGQLTALEPRDVSISTTPTSAHSTAAIAGGGKGSKEVMCSVAIFWSTNDLPRRAHAVKTRADLNRPAAGSFLPMLRRRSPANGDHYAGRKAGSLFEPVAQLAEQRSPKPQAGGSSPSWFANFQQPHGSANVQSHRSNNRPAGLVLAIQSLHRASDSTIGCNCLLRAQRSNGQPAGYRSEWQCTPRMRRFALPAWRCCSTERMLLRVDAVSGRTGQGSGAICQLIQKPNSSPPLDAEVRRRTSPHARPLYQIDAGSGNRHLQQQNSRAVVQKWKERRSQRGSGRPQKPVIPVRLRAALDLSQSANRKQGAA